MSTHGDLPSSMRYVSMREPGPPDVLSIAQTSVPRPRAGEVLIRVQYAGVNRPDCSQRAGSYPPPPDASPILGLEVAGGIAALGDDVTQWHVGDVVCALVPGGGYAEYCATPAEFCLPLPPGLSMLEAASLPENYFTVWHNVFERGRLQAGETMLVHGGSSGIGATAIQLGNAFGATVFATVGNAEKERFCRDIGADHVINYRDADFVQEVARMTNRRGVDVVLDMVGGDYIEKNIACLGLEGRLVLIAFLHGSRVEVDWRPVMVKRLTIVGSTMRASPQARKAAIAKALREHVWPLFAPGVLKPVIHRVFALEQAAQAHALMESSQHVGKIMLEVAAS